ncbi:MAG: hypothetical protein ACTS9Y_13390 [Methylophilus sp.]|uniref:hypothetical protein n=1 Tax=Methylophilus sp. TaxID=29541 RepID=UPI003F9FD1B8
MKTYDLALIPGVDTRLNIDYKFLLVLADGGYTFDVSLFKGSGFQKCEGVNAGFGLRLDGNNRGKELFFTSSNAQTIKVFVGDDEAIYQRLSGTVTINGGTLATVSNLTTLGTISNTVNVADAGESYGASYKSQTAMGVNTADTIVAPGANVNGIIIQRASMLAYNATLFMYPTLIAKTSTPLNTSDGDVILTSRSYGGGAYFASAGMDEPLKIAAGKGLYYINSTAESNAHRSVLYTLP